MKRIYMADDPFRIKIGDEKYYSFADLVMNFNPEEFMAVQKGSGKEGNLYKVFWDMYRDSIEEQVELYREAELRSKNEDYEK